MWEKSLIATYMSLWEYFSKRTPKARKKVIYYMLIKG